MSESTRRPAVSTSSATGNTSTTATTSASAADGTDAGSAPATKTRMNYRPDIDGFRGFAAIMVMGYHADVPFFEGSVVALDLFFVISGYVITILLLREWSRTGRIDWLTFYARRARRLIPAKATMLVGVLILSYFVMAPTGVRQETATSAAASAGFVSNLYFWRVAEVDYFGVEPGTGALLHTWSLSLEEQFYLGVPFVVLLAVVVGRLLKVSLPTALLLWSTVLVAGSLALAVAWADNRPDAAYYLPITRGYEFGLGCVLALIAHRIKLSHLAAQVMALAGAGLLVYLLVQPVPVAGYPSYWAVLPCLAAMAICWSGTEAPTMVSEFFSHPLLVGLGLVSYSWYLWHWPLLVMGEAVNLAPPPLTVRIGLVLVALLLGWLSYRFVEGIFYSRSDKRRTAPGWPAPRVIVTGVLAMALVAGLSGGALAQARVESRSTMWERVATQLDDVPDMPEACLEPGEIIPSEAGPCYLNTFDEKRPTLVLWGDSLAWMFIPALRRAARDEDINMVTFVTGSCPPFDYRIPTRGSELCVAMNKSAQDFVRGLAREDRPVRVILGASWENYRGVETQSLLDRRVGDPRRRDPIDRVAPKLRRGAEPLFERLGELGVPTDVVAPVAEVPRNVPLCMVSLLPISCDADRRLIKAASRRTGIWLRDITALLPNDAAMVYVDRALCDQVTCFAEMNGILTYFDDRHLSASRSRTMSRFFRPTVEKLVSSR